jgi:hypothetical protein
MMQEANYKTATDCARDTKMSVIRAELEQANKRAEQILGRLEAIAFGLLGEEVNNPASAMIPDGVKGYLDRGSLEGLINRLSELHGVMGKMERQIERIAADV